MAPINHDPLQEPEASWYYEDNGFVSGEAMDLAHQPILDCVQQILSQNIDLPNLHLQALDLGCGNGALISKIAKLHKGLTPAGVDLAPFKIDRARQLLPEFFEHFFVANLFDSDLFEARCGPIYLIILMVGRLIEVPELRARALLAMLGRQTRHLLVYAYEDYIRETMPFAEMASRVGLTLLAPHSGTNVSLAQVNAGPGWAPESFSHVL